MPLYRPAAERVIRAMWRVGLLRQRLAEPLLILLLTLLVVPRLPPGPCFDDSGDLQAAATLLGIAHPPGYPLLVAVGHILTRLPGVPPAYAVTLGCWAATLAALVLAVRIQQRLCVRPAVAVATVLLLALHPAVRNALFAPEVYGPSLALALGAVLSLICLRRDGGAGWLWAAALLLGAAIAGRPPLLLALPGFAVSAVLALRGRRRDEPGPPSAIPKRDAQSAAAAGRTRPFRAGLFPVRKDRREAPPVRIGPGRIAHGHVAAAGACFVLPLAVSAAYVWMRDAPDASYNYIEQYRFETGALPDATGGPAARIERALWLVAGRQYADAWISSWAALRERTGWVAAHVLPGSSSGVLAAWSAAALFGLVQGGTRRRRAHAAVHAAAAWALGGLLAGGLAFLVLFEVPGTAADFLPVVTTGAIGCGLAADGLIRRTPLVLRPALRLGALVGAAITLAVELLEAPRIVRDLDASPLLRRLDMATLPPGTVIFSAWRESPPLWYAQHVLTRRTDIRIINARPEAWADLAERLSGEAPFILFTREVDVPAGTELVEYRNLWRWQGRSAESARPPDPVPDGQQGIAPSGDRLRGGRTRRSGADDCSDHPPAGDPHRAGRRR